MSLKLESGLSATKISAIRKWGSGRVSWAGTCWLLGRWTGVMIISYTTPGGFGEGGRSLLAARQTQHKAVVHGYMPSCVKDVIKRTWLWLKLIIVSPLRMCNIGGKTFNLFERKSRKRRGQVGRTLKGNSVIWL